VAFSDVCQRHGATVEQMTIEVNKAKANLDTAEKDLNNMSILNKVLLSHCSVVSRLLMPLLGAQVIAYYPTGQVARISSSHRPSLQTGLPVSSL
jgi:GTP cyclohydrolase I